VSPYLSGTAATVTFDKTLPVVGVIFWLDAPGVALFSSNTMLTVPEPL